MRYILFTALLFCLFGCSSYKNKIPSINGKWYYGSRGSERVFVFTNGLYSQAKWDRDIVDNTNGRYYFNTNSKRLFTTLTLLPDMQIYDGDTVLSECENFDIETLSDSIMIVRRQRAKKLFFRKVISDK